MASKKTFIKIKRGLLAPKHRVAIREAVWLFMEMIDRADWETGIIYDWKDSDAAEKLGLSLPSVRQQRKKLEGRYIEVFQKQHSLQIRVLNWDDPKEKWNIQGDSQGDSQGVNEGAPCTIQGDSHSDRLLTPSMLQGDSQGDSRLSPVHIIKNIRIKNLRRSDSKVSSSSFPLPSLYSGDDFIPRVFSRVTGMTSIPRNDERAYIAIEGLRSKYPDVDGMVKYLQPFYDSWITRRGKDGRFFSKTNLAWLTDWAVGGEVPQNTEELQKQKIDKAKANNPKIPLPDPTCPICHGTGKQKKYVEAFKSERYVMCECVREEAIV